MQLQFKRQRFEKWHTLTMISFIPVNIIRGKRQLCFRISNYTSSRKKKGDIFTCTDNSNRVAAISPLHRLLPDPFISATRKGLMLAKILCTLQADFAKPRENTKVKIDHADINETVES